MAIEVEGARTHNLKGVSCRIPHGKVTVVTGPSGAGKSSLAFDTVYAEGQRRFVESMSTYARQFLEKMERPPVDSIENILPPVALKAVNHVKNARSTVGTLSEAHDVLRLLFTHLGEVHCPEGHGPATRSTADDAANLLASGAVGDRFFLVVRLPRPKRGSRKTLDELIRQGFGRQLRDGEILRLEPGQVWAKDLDPLPLVLGRFQAKGEASSQLVAAVEEAYRLGQSHFEAVGEETTLYLSPHLGCRACGRRFQRPTPPLFSFNSPLGACEMCQGFGRIVGVDAQRVIPDPRRTLRQRPFAPWNTPAYEGRYAKLFAACEVRGVSLDVPWEDLPEEDRQWVWSGPSRGKAGFSTLDAFFRWLERRSYRVHVRVLLARYRAYTPCPQCRGQRFQPATLAVRLAGKTLPELCAMSLEDLRDWFAQRRWTDHQKSRAGHLLEQGAERLEVLDRVGLGYLTLDRQARTLSGGEVQRIHLAAALGSGLTSTLYVLDEPTIGLHPIDSRRLLDLLRDLAGRGNTVLVVEHDSVLIRGADHLIDLGPEAGERGGELLVEGAPDKVLADRRSVTGRYLKPKKPAAAAEPPDRHLRERGHLSLEGDLPDPPRVRIHGARENNLKGIDVDFPLGCLVAVSGVSGSGKSTLVENVLYGTFKRSRGVVNVEPGACDALEGVEGLEDVILVDQRPLGRSSRSNPVTYVKAYDEIRKLFAATSSAREAGILAGHFSFNTDRGRCPECRGTGATEVDMQFMAPVSVVCDRCQGHRFQPQVLAVRWRGYTIAELLEITVDQAFDVFAGQRALCRKLSVLAAVGLGYLRLGQSTATLSGGEAQRLKLASFLGRRKRTAPRLYLFDEPTTGLHLCDIDLLYKTLRRLVDAGDSVLVVEHSPELIARLDWIIDLGPGGGTQGGELLFSGPLRSMPYDLGGPTAEVLRSMGVLREVAEGSRREPCVVS